MADHGHMQRFWDARAREDAAYYVDNRLAYDRADDAGFWEEGEADLERLFGMLDVRPGPDDVVLDVGCGVGRLLRPLSRTAREVHGIDVSGEMLRRAAENVPEAVLHHGDGTSLQPVPDGSVDAVVSLVVFQHIPDPAITLGYVTDMGRVLRPGGWAAFQVSNDPDVHRRDYPRPSLWQRLRGRAPKGQDDPAWRGSAVELDDLRAAAAAGGLEVEATANEGTQWCLVRLRRVTG